MRGRPFSPTVRKRALAMYQRGETGESIGRYLGVNHRTVNRWVQQAGLSRNGMDRMNAKGFYTAGEVCRRVGITYRQLDYWNRIGFVQASVIANGSGAWRGYTSADLDRLHLIARLLDAGVDLRALRAYGVEETCARLRAVVSPVVAVAS